MIQIAGEHPQMPRARRIALRAAALGLAVSLVGAIVNTAEFFQAYIWAYWFWLGIAIGCGQLLMIFQLTGGAWGFMTQRVLEAATRTFPYMFVLAIPLLFAIFWVYPYTDSDRIAEDTLLQHKLPYLNPVGIIARLAVYFLIWGYIAHLMNKWSLLQDETGDLAYQRRRSALAGPGIILYSLAVSFASVDWFMALEPEWTSSMYPVFHLVGQVLAALAVAILVTRHIGERSAYPVVFSPKAFHDLGNLLLAFVVLWAYVQVGQLIIIWQGNLPHGATWYLHRTRNGWAWVGVTLAVFHFFLPFFLLLSRRNKLRTDRLAAIAGYLLFFRLVDYFWNVAPAFRSEPFVHWMDLAAPIGLGGAWSALFLWQLSKRPALALRDPRLEEALEKA